MFFFYRKLFWRNKKKCVSEDERNVKKMKESVSGRWSESGIKIVKENENGRETETERGSVGGNGKESDIHHCCVHMESDHVFLL